MDISRALEVIRENKFQPKGVGYYLYKLKLHKPWFDKGSSELLD
jgi:hypothetical protein